MKRYILFGLTLLMAFPLSIQAQDDDEDMEEVETSARTFKVKQKQYATRVVKGVVLDAATKQPLSGAIVKADGMDGYSVLTEDDGTYELKVPLFASALFVSTPDYNPVRIGLQAGENQKQALLYSAVFSQEYGKQLNDRNDRSAEDFKFSNVINIKDEISNQLGAYAYTTSRNGTPGVGNVMFVGGLNSLNVNAQPLVVVDGVPLDQQYGRTLLHDGLFNDILTGINPADIEKVTVMRNGTALYGAKGANGVILVQTRRNKSMATRITASLSGGVTFEPKFLSTMNAEQYRGYASELLKSTNTRLNAFKFLDERQTLENGSANYYYIPYHQSTDWKDYIYRTAFTQNYGINVEGGDAVANYNLSVGFTSAQSPLKYNDMNRLNIRFNTDIDLSYRFTIRFDASFSNQTRNMRDDGAPETYDEGTPTSPAFLAYVKSPFLSPYTYGRGIMSTSHYDIDDESYLTEALALYNNYNWKLSNPVAINEYGDAENKNRFENSLLNIAATPRYRFNRHLSLLEHFSYTLVNTNEKYYIPTNGVPDYYVSSVNAFRENETRSLFSKQNSVMSDTRLEWENRFDAHQVSAFAGARILWDSFTSNSQLGYNTGNDKTPQMGSSLLNAQTTGANDSWNSIAWYAQANYNYMNRYYLQANLTMEGSSRFGSEGGNLRMFDAAWGLFPGVQASWVISNEPWMAKVKGIDFLRLTAGFDVSGNDDIDYYAARSYFRASQYLQAISGLAFDGIGNEKIQWETTRRFNVGLESNFISNRLNVQFNYFRSKTNNLLTRQMLGFLSGLSENWSNGGKLQNEGFDVAASVKVLALKDWRWEVGASMGHYKNKITELADGRQYVDNEVYGATIRTQVGQAANLFYGYKTLGVFATTEQAQNANLGVLSENGSKIIPFEAGDIHFADLLSDGVIDENDRTVIGDPNPDIYGNIFTTLSWKNFQLNVRFNYSLGNDVYNYMRSQMEGGQRFMNQSTALVRSWQVEGQETDIPRLSFQDPMGNARFSDRWIEDGSYLKLKTVTLSYNLPLKSQYLQGLQFWIQGNNLLTLTRYLGTDPEFAMTSAVIGQGIDLGRIGHSRSVVAGIKINL